MSAQKTPGLIEAFLGLMGALLVLFALFVFFYSGPIVDAWWLKGLLAFEILSLGLTEICVAWLVHRH